MAILINSIKSMPYQDIGVFDMDNMHGGKICHCPTEPVEFEARVAVAQRLVALRSTDQKIQIQGGSVI